MFGQIKRTMEVGKVQKDYSAGAARLPIWLRLRLLGGGADRAHYAHQAPPMHRIFHDGLLVILNVRVIK